MAHQICIYCQNEPGTTKDHTPPKNLFPANSRNNLITVPCCRSCNDGFSADEEYFQAIISSIGESQKHHEAKTILSKVLRSFEREQSIGFRTSLRNSISQARIFSHSGLYLGKGNKINVKMDRIYRVIEKTTLGLLFEEMGFLLPDDYSVRSEYIEHISQINKLFEIFKNCPRKRVFDKSIFSYKSAQLEADNPSSAWLLTFYDAHVFLVIINRK